MIQNQTKTFIFVLDAPRDQDLWSRGSLVSSEANVSFNHHSVARQWYTQRCYQDQGVLDQDQTKTRQAETKTETRQTETETETKTREAETKTKTKTSRVETKTKTKTSKKWS